MNGNQRERRDDFGSTLRPDEEDDLNALIGSSKDNSAVSREGFLEEPKGEISDDEDEWDGAQVVVLKEGKHLTEDEIAQHRSKEKQQDEQRDKDGKLFNE